VMANSARLSPIDKAQTTLPAFGVYGGLTGTALLIVFAIAIYLAALSPGNWPADIALMTAFP
jgi:hypothetical protein